MQRTMFALCLVFSALCVTTSLGGCAGSPCEVSFQKMKACFANKKCADLGDNKESCESYQNNQSYSEQVAACEKAKDAAGGLGAALGSLVSCQCEGLQLAAAEELNKCELDENCECKK